MCFQKALKRIKLIGLWLWSGKFHICSFLSVISTILYLTGRITFYPKIVAFVFTIVGLFIIFYFQFVDARDFSYHRPNTIQNWLKSFPAGNPITLAVGSTSIGITSLKARLRTTIPDNLPIEEKVAYLIEKIDRIQTTIEKIDDRITEVNTLIESQLKSLRSEFDNYNSSLKEIIASHAVGDFDFNLFGIVITFCGTIIQFFNP